MAAAQAATPSSEFSEWLAWQRVQARWREKDRKKGGAAGAGKQRTYTATTEAEMTARLFQLAAIQEQSPH